MAIRYVLSLSAASLLKPKRSSIQLISQAARKLHISTLSPDRESKQSRGDISKEAKFTPTPASIAILRSNSGIPPFNPHIHLGTHTLKDTYYDTPKRLLQSQSIWLRYRSPPGTFELKNRRSGSYRSSAFLETKGRDNVEKAMKKFLPRAAIV